jgi:predicted RNA-binding Zn-ribbon protein involved in translation (DUF1610 family)
VVNLRELIGAALNATNLTENPLYECALDRIGALAFSDELGGCLWRLKYAQHARTKPGRDFYQAATALLTKRLRTAKNSPNNREFTARIAAIAIDEWLRDWCQPCGGRGNRIAADTSVRHTCPTCNGTGIGRHSDASRMQRLGLDRKLFSKYERRFHQAHAAIADADVQAWRDVRAQLGEMANDPRVEKLLAAAKRTYTLRAISSRSTSDSTGADQEQHPGFAVSSATG